MNVLTVRLNLTQKQDFKIANCYAIANKTGFKTAARQVQEYALRSVFSDD